MNELFLIEGVDNRFFFNWELEFLFFNRHYHLCVMFVGFLIILCSYYSPECDVLHGVHTEFTHIFGTRVVFSIGKSMWVREVAVDHAQPFRDFVHLRQIYSDRVLHFLVIFCKLVNVVD